MGPTILALDQGTTSSRAILFDRAGLPISQGQVLLTQHYPKEGWVEHDPMEIWESELKSAAEAIEKSGITGSEVAAVGITNQRETTILWERDTGRPVMNAIVWQCRRSAPIVDRLAGDAELIRKKTGLLPDAYFSATKLRWMLDHIPGAQRRAENGELLFGTVDCWLIWRLTGRHVSDVSNCSRTMLFDIDRGDWDEDLCRLLNIPMCILPEPVGNSELYGHVISGLPGLEGLAGAPVCGSAGDQQAALFGQGCFRPGMVKNTYGTGCFTLMNTGTSSLRSSNGLITSVGWRLGEETTYILEGSVYNAGSAIQWLRDELGLISTAHEIDILAETVPDNGGVYMVPAFTGLGAPYWDMYARGGVFGLTRGSSRAHLARAVLESIAYQVYDLCRAMSSDIAAPVSELWVDGGASVSDFLLQFQSELVRCPVIRPKTVEATAAGAAYLAGLRAGVWNDLKELETFREVDRVFEAQKPKEEADRLLKNWQKAVDRALRWIEAE